jgi:hypothetical protein
VSIKAGTGQTVFRRGGFNPAPPRAPAPEAVAAELALTAIKQSTHQAAASRMTVCDPK